MSSDPSSARNSALNARFDAKVLHLSSINRLLSGHSLEPRVDHRAKSKDARAL